LAGGNRWWEISNLKMEKYRVYIREKEYLVEIEGDRVFIDGQPYHAGIHLLNEFGLFMVEKDEKKREFHIKPQEDGTYLVTTRGLQVGAVVEPVKGKSKKRTEKINTGSIAAPIPGVVMDIKVEVGENIELNQVLVVLESMKMLMEFRAPLQGQVEKISITKGQKIEKGDQMIKIKKGEE